MSGHSLGGATAQRVGLDYSHLVGEIFTLNSPKLERNVVDTLPCNHMKVTHLVMDADIIPYVGGGRFSAGALLTNGQGGQEVYLVSGGGHTSKKINDYCIRGEEVSYRRLTVAQKIERDGFWALIFNFVRTNTDFV